MLQPGRHLAEDADVLLHRSEQAVEVALHRGQVLQQRHHRRQLLAHQRLDLRGRHVQRLREQGAQLGGIRLHAAEALEVRLELGEVRSAHHRGDPAEWHEHLVVVVGGRLDLIGLHDRLEAAQHPLAGRSLARQRQRQRCDHKRETNREHRPQQLAVHLDLLRLPDPHPLPVRRHPQRR